MSKASSAALAIGVGYLLGRKRRLRLALVLTGAVATGKLGGVATQAIKRGGSLIGSSEALGKLSPEFGKMASTVSGDLADAGKAAVQAAVANRINQVTDSLHERAEGLRNPLDADGGEETESGEPGDRDGSRDTGGAETDGRPKSGRPGTGRPRRREPGDGDSDGRRRPGEPARRDHESGPRKRSATRSGGGEGSRPASARTGGR